MAVGSELQCFGVQQPASAVQELPLVQDRHRERRPGRMRRPAELEQPAAIAEQQQPAVREAGAGDAAEIAAGAMQHVGADQRQIADAAR